MKNEEGEQLQYSTWMNPFMLLNQALIQQPLMTVPSGCADSLWSMPCHVVPCSQSLPGSFLSRESLFLQTGFSRGHPIWELFTKGSTPFYWAEFEKKKKKKAFVNSIENPDLFLFFALTTMTPLEKVVGTEKRSHSQSASDDWQVRQPDRPFRRWVGVEIKKNKKN